MNSSRGQWDRLWQNVEGHSEYYYDRFYALAYRWAIPGKRILEVGCGSGRGLQAFLRSGMLASGVDISPTACALTRRNLSNFLQADRVQLYCSDIFSLPFGDRFFDITFSEGTLEHYSEAEGIQALLELRRVTRKGGLVATLVPNSFPSFLCRTNNKWSVPSNASYDVWRLRELLRSAGLNKVRAYTIDLRRIARIKNNQRHAALGFIDRPNIPLLNTLGGMIVGEGLS